MYVICYHNIWIKQDVWETVSGEDAMHIRVNEICRECRLSADEVMVFNMEDRL